ncbi:hypothetical protein AMTR_s00027p00088280 [Amborella trichopoda]|uniref:Uncharacterized protein n=1 Tax=Amborella trichopoda TaxID=13333 RepID=W1PSC4_AMBTC|nr:hypothetical protein AMTR_s00027p00088280 [Amborella trichopoda]
MTSRTTASLPHEPGQVTNQLVCPTNLVHDVKVHEPAKLVCPTNPVKSRELAKLVCPTNPTKSRTS